MNAPPVHSCSIFSVVHLSGQTDVWSSIISVCLCQCSRDCVSERACKTPSANVCPHLRLHSFRGGVSRIKECVFAYAACCLQEREQSKKDVRGGQRERGQILHCGVGGRKGSSELGSGWKLTEKDFRLVPCGDKSLKIPPCIQPENGREEQHAELRGLFLLGMKRKFVFLKHCRKFLVYETKIKKKSRTLPVLSKHNCQPSQQI